jgi:hypothetical protein
VVQIDHTLLDIILVDDLHRLSIGRPWITLAIDVFSRIHFSGAACSARSSAATGTVDGRRGAWTIVATIEQAVFENRAAVDSAREVAASVAASDFVQHPQ